jgi:glycerol-3-phosphate O-acyltransferase/dihydroxyacetone phosphate acyltransferase
MASSAPPNGQELPNEHFPVDEVPKHKELNPMTNWVYDVFLWILTILVDLFFREIHPRGSWKVPRRGPVIFVAAPHANQVCDVLCAGGGLGFRWKYSGP